MYVPEHTNGSSSPRYFILYNYWTLTQYSSGDFSDHPASHESVAVSTLALQTERLRRREEGLNVSAAMGISKK